MNNEDEDVEPGVEDFAELVKELQETPNTLASIVEEFRMSEPPALAGGAVSVRRPDKPTANAGGSDDGLRWKNSDGKFSALETICHLRDIETEGYTTRINRILDETNPVLADIDGGRLAFERNYNDQDPDPALSAFAVARAKNLDRLRGVGNDGLERKGTLEGVGLVTLRRLTEMMREHDEGHIEDLRALFQNVKRLREARLTL